MGCGNSSKEVVTIPKIIENTPEEIKKKIHNFEEIKASVSTPGKTTKRKLSLKGSFTCFFCGGAGCKHEDWHYAENPAITGLHSSWITPNIIASQRLSTRLIREYNILDQFKKCNLKAVFNLQEKGEHPSCGDGIHEESGFSYNPSDLGSEVLFYNYSWPDFGIPDCRLMLNICKTMDNILQSGGKLLVHCHAGMGRTGLTIGCYLLYARTYGDNREKVKTLIQSKRSQALQSSKQVGFFNLFGDLLQELRVLFVPSLSERYNLDNCLERQRYLLNGPQRHKLRFLPRLIFEVCDRVLLLISRELESTENLINGIIGDNKNSDTDEKKIALLKLELNKGDWTEFFAMPNLYVLLQLLFDFLEQLSDPVLSYSQLQSQNLTPGEMIQELSQPQKEILKALNQICQQVSKASIPQSQELCTMRIAVALLGLRGFEQKCFIGRRLIDWNFINIRAVEATKELLETETKGMPELLTPIRPRVGMDIASSPSLESSVHRRYEDFTKSFCRLEDPERESYFKKFDNLVKEIEGCPLGSAKSESHLPGTMPNSINVLPYPPPSQFVSLTPTKSPT